MVEKLLEMINDPANAVAEEKPVTADHKKQR